MNISLWLFGTFASLGLSILGAWAQPKKEDKPGYLRWLPFFTVAIGCGFAGQFLKAPAVVSLALLFALCFVLNNSVVRPLVRNVVFALTVVVSLGLALHLLPGFKNPVLVDGIKFSAISAPFTQYANFDKASVGLMLLLFVCPRVASAKELGEVLRKAAPATIVTAVLVLGLSLVVGFTRVDVKVPEFTAVFLATNLLFTCVAEEAFFRGLLQTKISSAFSKFRYGEKAAIACSGILFGAAHVAGGPAYVLFATVAGIGYAFVYSKTKRIEASIFAHFIVNALHFVLLTYPRVA